MNIKSWLRTSSLTDRHTGRLLALLIVSAMALTACFGGGVGLGSTPQSRLSNPAGFEKATVAAKDAATADPVKSSSGIAQSSNARDEIVATASYSDGELSIKVTNKLEGSSWGTPSFSTALHSTNQLLLGSLETLFKEDDEDEDEVEDEVEDEGEVKFSRSTLEKTVNDGIVYVDVYTDLQAPVNTDSDTNSDYLVGGVWLFIPNNLESRSDSDENAEPGDENAEPGLEIGAFMDGSTLTSSAYLQEASTANYLGKAAGLFLVKPDAADGIVGAFEATVKLGATFGSSPVISGSLTAFEFADRLGGPLEDDLSSPPQIAFNLGEAIIGSENPEDERGGFFKGITSGSYTAPSSNTNEDSSLNDDEDSTLTAVAPSMIEGKWGGQFYGAAAGKVGGTFGGKTADSKLEFVGVFAAGKGEE